MRRVPTLRPRRAKLTPEGPRGHLNTKLHLARVAHNASKGVDLSEVPQVEIDDLRTRAKELIIFCLERNAWHNTDTGEPHESGEVATMVAAILDEIDDDDLAMCCHNHVPPEDVARYIVRVFLEKNVAGEHDLDEVTTHLLRPHVPNNGEADFKLPLGEIVLRQDPLPVRCSTAQ